MYIGEKLVKTTEENGLTPGGVKIIKVIFEDDSVKNYSELMYNNIISEETCTLDQLRDKRVQPVVSLLLTSLREYGVESGDLGYISQMLNRSLEYNREEALKVLLSQHMPKPLSLDDVDLVTIDRILRNNVKEDASNQENK